MSTEIYSLVYYSHNRMEHEQPELKEQIASILAASQSNNRNAGVTGALIFNRGIFAQVLEGDLSQVEQTFERIQRDPRHGDVQVLAFDKVQSRTFPSWSMGYVGTSRENENVFGQIAHQTGFDAARMEGERILKILHSIALEEEDRRVPTGEDTRA
ncbi:MAG: hypothetical protein V7634_3751 [Bradyrhizobium sp.]|jgi:hypothetical protein